MEGADKGKTGVSGAAKGTRMVGILTARRVGALPSEREVECGLAKWKDVGVCGERKHALLPAPLGIS